MAEAGDRGNSQQREEEDTVDATRIRVEQEFDQSTSSSGGGDVRSRPATASASRGRTRPQPQPYRPYEQQQHEVPIPSQRFEPFQEEDDSHLGAVGGAPRSYENNVLHEKEARVSNQARQLLEIFISDRSEHDHLPEQQRNILNHDVLQCDKRRMQESDESLKEVSSALRIIGDQLAQEHELNRLIDLVPVDSPKETFFKVCRQMFADKQYNWGRVVALFYFAYKLLAKAVMTTVSGGIPWMRELIGWAMDFFSSQIADWIISRGGWTMISEYWGMSNRTFGVFVAATICAIIYVWRRK